MEVRVLDPRALTERRTAIHECGHATIARVLGLDVVEVALLDNDESFCQVHGEDLPAILTTIAAGPTAQERLFGGNGWDREDPDGDYQLLHRLGDQEAVDVARARAEVLVRHHQESIRCVADLLQERRRLTGDEIDSILAGAL